MAVTRRHKCFTWSYRTNIVVLKPFEGLTLIWRALETVLIEDGLKVLNLILMKLSSGL